MKLSMKITAFLSAFALISAFTLPNRAAAIQVSAPQISQNCVYSTSDEAAEQMRQYIKERKKEFSIELDSSAAPKETVSQIMAYKAFDETGAGTEGDYLRFAVKKLYCGVYRYSDRYRLEYRLEYYTTVEEEAQLSKKIDGILDSLNMDGLSDYNKALLIYRYVTSKITYPDELDDPYTYTAYGAVMNNIAVCQGITQLLYRMYNDSGIPCRIIAGIARDMSGNKEDGYHVWLLIKVDGKYYLADPTWDLGAEGENFRYFLKSSDSFDSTFVMRHIPYNDNGLTFPDYNSDEFKNTYPVSVENAPSPKCSAGDINGDEQINAIDASVILTDYSRVSICGYSAFTVLQSICADINSDGSVNAVDASYVLSYYAHISCGGEGSIENFIKNEVSKNVR